MHTDPAPHGMGYDHCPYCFSDWKEPHDRSCAWKGQQGQVHRPGEGNDHEPDL